MQEMDNGGLVDYIGTGRLGFSPPTLYKFWGKAFGRQIGPQVLCLRGPQVPYPRRPSQKHFESHLQHMQLPMKDWLRGRKQRNMIVPKSLHLQSHHLRLEPDIIPYLGRHHHNLINTHPERLHRLPMRRTDMDLEPLRQHRQCTMSMDRELFLQPPL